MHGGVFPRKIKPRKLDTWGSGASERNNIDDIKIQVSGIMYCAIRYLKAISNTNSAVSGLFSCNKTLGSPMIHNALRADIPGLL